ncbi:hypothetical protein JW826_01260 [Candidatus Woesearchaeota archaeon]|nr:hypothetical protein [Candidatus Woesearchaeota archaeon]
MTRFQLLKSIPLDELVTSVRRVPLVQKAPDGSDILVYKDANISLHSLKPEEVNPTTFYLIKRGLQLQRDLRTYLMGEHGIDSLNLDGALEISNSEGEIWTLTPPIIELAHREVAFIPGQGEIRYGSTFGVEIPIINDGAHRVQVARERGTKFTGLVISGIPREHPFYAHPNSWDLVRVVDETPKTKAEKKLYLREDCYALYRDFGVLGCGKPRHLGK